MSATAWGGAAILVVIGVTLPKSTIAAGSACEAFGRTYRDGESFTLSTGEYGYPRTYICARGTWREYDGTLCQLRPRSECMPVALPQPSGANGSERGRAVWQEATSLTTPVPCQIGHDPDSYL